MQIFVDADACPVVGIVEKVAKEHNLPVTLLCDTNPVSYTHLKNMTVSESFITKYLSIV